MGAGAHGMNGINPIISRKIWQRYNLPRSTHGLDIQILNNKELKRFETHEIKYMKQFQTLPKFAPNILSYILTGGKPCKLILHQKMMTLLMNIRRKNGIELEIGKRQLAMKPDSSNSWFHRVNKVANLYKLPNSYTVLEEPAWDKIDKSYKLSSNKSKVYTVRNSTSSLGDSWLLCQCSKTSNF